MDFAQRHIGPDGDGTQAMLAAVGYASLDDLTQAALPPGLAAGGPLDLPGPLSEADALAELRRIAARNHVLTPMIGLGYYGTVTPAVIRRNVLENPAWYTAYTPYQPEISQGRLEALLNFQTMVADLTGLPLAGASMLDEATAAAEAMTLARRVTGRGSVFLADADCLPQVLSVLETRAEPLGISLVVGEVTAELIAAQPDGELFGVLLPYPGASGAVRDLAPLIAAAQARGALAAVAADLLAMTLLTPPGELGADVAVGTTQRFGVPLGYGGPHAGYIAVREGLKRQLPGRLVGVSQDAAGHRGYRLALQAREQHIRREKATSNICTAQVLLAVMAAMYAAYHGPDGLTAIATRVHRRAADLAAVLGERGLDVPSGGFFDTVRVTIAGGAAAAVGRARVAGYNLHLAGPDAVQIACDETTTARAGARGGRGAVRLPGGGDHPAGRGCGRRGAGAAGGAAAFLGVPHPPGVPCVPQRDRHAALPAAAGRLRHRARPVDDPARLVHDEAQRGRRDGAGDLAGVRRAAPVRAGRPGRRVHRADHQPGAGAGRDHRVRRGVRAAQRRVAGRAGRAAGHPRLPPVPAAAGADRVPDPGVGARHQRGQRGARRAAGGGGQVRRGRRHRPR